MNTDTATIQEIEGALPRPAKIDSTNRNQIRRWLTAHGVPYATAGRLTVQELAAAYNTTDELNRAVLIHNLTTAGTPNETETPTPKPMPTAPNPNHPHARDLARQRRAAEAARAEGRRLRAAEIVVWVLIHATAAAVAVAIALAMLDKHLPPH